MKRLGIKKNRNFFPLLASLFIFFSSTAQASKPDIIIIIADDLGWNDVGYHGSDIKTPFIDTLASRGVELNRFYAHPTCSPTRSALMTGQSPIRLGGTRATAGASWHQDAECAPTSAGQALWRGDHSDETLE